MSVTLSDAVSHLEGVHKKRYLEKLAVAGLNFDPYLLSAEAGTDLVKAASLPDFTPHDLYHYVINGISSYTGADLKAYKSIDAYQFFVAGWVTSTRCYCTNGGNYLIMGKVHHSQSLSETQLKPWVSVKKDGTVLCGHCTCKAGLGEVCSHITALLYALESAVKHMEDKSCTDGPRQWGHPSVKTGKALFEEGSGIDFSNPAKRRSCLDQKSPSGPSAKKATKEETDQFYSDLDKASQKMTEKSGLLRILPQYCNQFKPKVVSLGLPQPLTELYSPEHMKLSQPDLMKKCDTVFNDMEITPEQAVKIEEETRQQGKCRLWYDMRAGRVTASRFKAAARTDPANPSKSLIRQICYPNLCRWGCEHEQNARETYKSLASQQHQGLSVCDSGLHIDPSRPYLGASPDGLVSCTCCGSGVLEIKCPHCAKDTGVLSAAENQHFYIQNIDGRYELNREHQYYYQVQAQLFVTNRKYCDFMVWSASDCFLQRILPDAELFTEANQKVETFFKSGILPELLAKKYTYPHGQTSESTHQATDD